MMGQVWNRLQLLFAHGVGLLIGDEYIQARLLDGEILRKIFRAEPYGLSYRPKPGCQPYMLFPAGDRSYGVAIVIGDKRYQVDLTGGEVALHDDQGQKVHLTRTGIVIDGAGLPIKIHNTPDVYFDTPSLRCSGEIMDRCDADGRTMDAMRSVYDVHTHHENDGGGETNAPTQRME